MDGKTQPVEDPPFLSYQTNMWFQLKTLLTSILLLIALCFGANANFDALNRTDAKIIPVGSEHTGYQIKGGLEIVTVAVPGAVIKALKHLKIEGKLPNSTSNRAVGKGDANSVSVPRSIGADIPSTPVHNINEFFSSITGEVFKFASSRTSKIYDGQRVYRADRDIVLQDGTKIRRGDQFYLDGLHKNHLEVFDARGNPRIKVDLAGNNLGSLPSGIRLK